MDKNENGMKEILLVFLDNWLYLVHLSIDSCYVNLDLCYLVGSLGHSENMNDPQYVVDRIDISPIHYEILDEIFLFSSKNKTKRNKRKITLKICIFRFFFLVRIQHWVNTGRFISTFLQYMLLFLPSFFVLFDFVLLMFCVGFS